MDEVSAEKDRPVLAGQQAADASKHCSRLLRRWAWPGSSCTLWAFRRGVQGCIGLARIWLQGEAQQAAQEVGFGQGAHASCGLSGEECRAALVCLMSLAARRSTAGRSGGGLGQGAHVSCGLSREGCRAALVY